MLMLPEYEEEYLPVLVGGGVGPDISASVQLIFLTPHQCNDECMYGYFFCFVPRKIIRTHESATNAVFLKITKSQMRICFRQTTIFAFFGMKVWAAVFSSILSLFFILLGGYLFYFIVNAHNIGNCTIGPNRPRGGPAGGDPAPWEGWSQPQPAFPRQASDDTFAHPDLTSSPAGWGPG